MWENVKPISLYLKQENEDGTYFKLYFYSTDYELIKLKEAYWFSKKSKIIGTYKRIHSTSVESQYDSNFFVERLSKETTQKLIEYYENSNLYIEYLL